MSATRRVAIIGRSDCGKTVLAKWHTVEQWRTHGRRFVAFDPLRGRWPATGIATDDWTKFERVVWTLRGLAVFIDEGTEAIARARDKSQYFTRIRHQAHNFFCLAHGIAVFLPMQRAQFTELYLFRVDPDEAAEWSRLFADRDLLAADSLGQYEFLHKRAFRPVSKGRLTPEQVAAAMSSPNTQ